MNWRALALGLALSWMPAAAEAQSDAPCVDSAGKPRGVITGRVLSRRDSAPAAGAHVVARWYGQRSQSFSSEVLTNDRGAFRFCGFPLETPLFLRADAGNRESSPTEARVPAAEGSARVDLILDPIEDEIVRPAAAVASPGATAVEPLNMTGARTLTLAQYNAPAGRGTIVGLVTTKTTGAPLPYADLLVGPFGAAGFTSAEGRFRLTNVPAGRIEIRARRIGFAPATINATVRADGTDTLTISLPTIALQLSRVKVSDAVCPNRAPGTIDTALVTILQQVQLNAERGRLLARQHPFEMVLQRVVANEGRDPFDKASVNPRRIVDTITVDTVTATLDNEWRYEPGNLVRRGAPTGNRRLGAPDRMAVPQLVDFADSAFVATHCFRYAGIAALEGQRMLRVNFEPIKSLKERDVSGALYFDTLTYQIRHSTLDFEYPSPKQAGDIWVTRMDTWFQDIAPTLPAIQRISQRTTVRTATRPDAWPGQAAWEDQRLIGVRFLGLPPGNP